jgi:hypothetical protein
VSCPHGGPSRHAIELGTTCCASSFERFAQTRGGLRRASPAVRDCALLQPMYHRSNSMSMVLVVKVGMLQKDDGP